MEGIELYGNTGRGRAFCGGLERADFLFSLVISYTATCEIPGITIAGSNPELLRYTPPADAEFLHYGYCRSLEGIPMTPDGKPTPALLSKAALESASIPHVIVNAGSAVEPQLPYIHTGLEPGRNIAEGPAMDESELLQAIDYGRIAGRTLASLTDCLVIGESIPGGTTTALAVMRGLGVNARVSSSIPQNPTGLKDGIVSQALGRLDSDEPLTVAAALGDPMIPTVAGMLSAASEVTQVILAGGTQMAAVLALGRTLGFRAENVAVGTTSYVVNDASADMLEAVRQAADVPVLAVDPMLAHSKVDGLRAYSDGFAKEGAGAGGSMIASMLRTGAGPMKILELAEKEYARALT